MDHVLLTCREAAHLLSVKPATIRAWTSSRKIPSIKLGGKSVRYRIADVERLIAAGERPAAGTAAPALRG